MTLSEQLPRRRRALIGPVAAAASAARARACAGSCIALVARRRRSCSRRARRAGARREAAPAVGHELGLPEQPVVASSSAARRSARPRSCPRDTAAIEIPFAGEALPRGMTLEVRDQSKRVVATAPTRAGVRARATRFALPAHARRRRRRQVCLRPAARPGGAVLGSREKTGHELNGLIVAGGGLDGLLPPRRGAADLDAARDRAADRAHARPPRRRVARRDRRRCSGGERRRSPRGGCVGPAARAPPPGRADRRARGGPQHARVGPAHAGLPDPGRDFHLSYVQDLAEHGKPPRAPTSTRCRRS